MTNDRRLPGRSGKFKSSGKLGGGNAVVSASPGKRSLTQDLAFDSLQQPAAVQQRGSTATAPMAPGKVHAIAQAGLDGGGQQLPYLDEVQRGFGAYDISGIHAHIGGRAGAAATAIGASAYASRSGVGFAAAPDLHTAAHEAAHVVQQRAGVSLDGGIGQRGDRYEQHADEVADRVVRGESAEPLLTELTGAPQEAGTTANATAIQCEGDSPTGVSDPKALIPIDKFIEYVEAVETAYPEDTPTDIITRIRVQYYSGIAFESLIPDAHFEDHHWFLNPDIAWTTSRHMDEDRINEVDPEAYSHLTAHADENGLGDNPSPYIVLQNGERIDVGHLLLGLDALIHPNTGDPYATYGIPNIDPSSWAADLGIASVWTTLHEESGSPPKGAPVKLDTPDLDAYYNMSAPTEDLLSDVDSFGLHGQYAWIPGGQPLSLALRGYYLGLGDMAPSVSRRWQTFCRRNGLTYTNTGNAVSWTSGLEASLVTRIDTFNDMYAAGGAGAMWEMVKAKVGNTISRRIWPHTPEVVNRFLTWIGSQLTTELATRP